MWSATDGERVERVELSEEPLRAVAVGSGGVVAVGGDGGTVTLVAADDLSARTEVEIGAPVTDLAFSPD